MFHRSPFEVFVLILSATASPKFLNAIARKREGGRRMRKLGLFAVMVILVGVISFSSPAFGQSGSRVLLIPREGSSLDLDLMIKMEVGVMTVILKNAGFEVDIATTSGQPILGPTQKLDKIMKLGDIDLNNYKGIILACMAVGAFPGAPVSQEAVALVKKALSEGKPVAANSNSGTVLAEAGVLKGKKFAFQRDPLKTTAVYKTTDPRFSDAIYSGQGVVQDGKIITSGVCAYIEKASGFENVTAKLTRTFIAELGSK
jgi:putative intracellular protease/amidase